MQSALTLPSEASPPRRSSRASWIAFLPRVPEPRSRAINSASERPSAPCRRIFSRGRSSSGRSAISSCINSLDDDGSRFRRFCRDRKGARGAEGAELRIDLDRQAVMKCHETGSREDDARSADDEKKIGLVKRATG